MHIHEVGSFQFHGALQRNFTSTRESNGDTRHRNRKREARFGFHDLLDDRVDARLRAGAC
jgi:hypothetical protein